jgi:hypothetical protein
MNFIRSLIAGTSSNLIKVLALAAILAGVVSITILFATRLAELGFSKKYILAISPLFCGLVGLRLYAFQWNVYAQTAKKPEKILSTIPFFSVIAGSAAAQLVLESFSWRMQFSSDLGEIETLRTIYFWGGLILAACLLVLTRLREKRK